MSAPIVFFDIAGPDETQLRRFFETVFDWPSGNPGPFMPGNMPDLGGNIRQDPSETRIYIGVPDVTHMLKRVVEAGGSVDAPRFERPGVVVLGLFRDPAGNPWGLVEMADGKPIVP